MGMYSSLEGTANIEDVNGLPNVGQYGWTAYEIENYKQLVDYVNEAKSYADSVKTDKEYIDSLVTVVNAIKNDIDNVFNDIKNQSGVIKNLYDTINGWYSQISIWKNEISSARLEVSSNLEVIRQIFNQINTLHNDIVIMKNAITISEANSKTSEINAKTSETNSQDSYNKCYELYLELKQGQVYRGIWNPNSGAYPNPDGTNSYWDVVLDSGQDEVSFDGKRWFFGDRLLYALIDGRYYQSQSGATTVKSVNGKNGAVVLTANDIKALPSTGGTLTGSLSVQGGSISSTESLSTDILGAGNFTITGNSTDGYAEIAGKPKDSVNIVKNKSLRFYPDETWRIGSSKIFYEGFYPTAENIGTYTKQEIDTKFENYYSKSEIDVKLDSKATVDFVNNLSNSKVDKTTTINGHLLSNNILLSPSDIGAISKSGDTINGQLTVNIPNTTYGIEMMGSETVSSKKYLRKFRSSVPDTIWHETVQGSTYRIAAGLTDSVDVMTVDTNGQMNLAGQRVYTTGFKPTPSDINAADVEVGASDIKVLPSINADRTKEVKIYSKDNNLYTISQDGTVAKFYNDRTYRPNISDFGGLMVENGNEVNFPLEANKTELYFNYRQKGASAVDRIIFSNGKSQLAGRANIEVNDVVAKGNIGVSGYIGMVKEIFSDDKPKEVYAHSILGKDPDINAKNYLRKFRGGTGATIFHETVDNTGYTISIGDTDSVQISRLSNGGDLSLSGEILAHGSIYTTKSSNSQSAAIVASNTATSLGHTQAQLEVHGNGNINVATHDGTNWYYPISMYRNSNDIRFNGKVYVGSDNFIIQSSGRKHIQFQQPDGSSDGFIYKDPGENPWIINFGTVAACDFQLSPSGSFLVPGYQWAAKYQHGYGSQPGNKAPLHVDFKTVSGASDYYPIVRGTSSSSTIGYATQVDFGILRDASREGGSGWGNTSAMIRLASDEGSGGNHPNTIFSFSIYGDFKAERDIIATNRCMSMGGSIPEGGKVVNIADILTPINGWTANERECVAIEYPDKYHIQAIFRHTNSQGNWQIATWKRTVSHSYTTVTMNQIAPDISGIKAFYSELCHMDTKLTVKASQLSWVIVDIVAVKN